MLKAGAVCPEGLYPFQLKCLSDHSRVILWHKIYYKLKAFESRYNDQAKISTEKLLLQASVL